MEHIKITKKYLKYSWKWKVREDCCLICQQEFNVGCPNCKHPIECVPCTGKCSHTFHNHCILEWLETSKCCPLCRAPWEPMKLFEYKAATMAEPAQ